MKKIILIFLLSTLFHWVASPRIYAAPPCLQEKFSESASGDFVVTAQEGHYSLLLIRSISPQRLYLEEVSVPLGHIDLKKIDWKGWVEGKAPGHTSWTLYEIDRSSGKLVECFSYSKNGWLYLDESEQFLTRLLFLPLERVPEEQRKKIGPQPLQGETDRRATWNPPLVVEGKKISKPTFEVMKAKWPEDSSRLSLCTVELYFSKEDLSLAFPYWIEIQSPHYAFKVRAIDSGHNLSSPMRAPHKKGDF